MRLSTVRVPKSRGSTAQRSFQSLPVSTSDRPVAPSTKRICLVTEEIAGPDFNGGIGTANRGLVLALRAEGYEVDVLYTRVDHGQPFCFRGAFADQVKVFQGLGIRLSCIRHDGQWSDWLAKSYRALEHLVRYEYDLVFFNDCHGTAYYPLLSRRTGNPRLARTIMCVVAHSSTQWIAEINEKLITSIDDLRVIELERRSVELADIVISPSSYILRKYREYGWKLPKATYIQPNILQQERRPTSTLTGCRVAVEELVFFGRLETRKGLWIFCNALERIKYRLVGRTVTFLGKFTTEDGESTGLSVIRRAAAWPFEVRFLHDYDQEQALNYLKTGARLAVMPSLADNSPCVILECLNENIPFVAASGSGGQELLSPKSHRDCLFEPTVDALAEKILKTLNEGAFLGLASFDPDENQRTFKRWVNSVLTSQVDRSTVRTSGHDDRPVLLAVAPSALDVSGCLRSLDQILAQFDDVDLILLSDKADELSGSLDRNGKDGPHKHLQVFDARAYPRALEAISAVGVGPIAVFQLGRAITPEIVTRAQTCFLENNDLSAVTGHTRGEESAELDDLPSFMSSCNALPVVQRYLIGNAPTLFALTQETNDGFAIFRRSALSLLASVPPLDQQYSRLKRVSDWIHELLIALYTSAKQFELLPDTVSETVSEEAAFEVPQLCQIMRSYGNSHLGFAPGSPQALISRLAIDGSRSDDLRRASHECLSDMAQKLGAHPNDWPTNPNSDEFLILLSTMAYASGKIDLANELLAEVLGGDGVRISRSGLFPRAVEWAQREAKEIRLFDHVVAGDFDKHNLNHEWSFRVFEQDREIENHPNPGSEGRALMRFAAVELGEVDHFCGAVRVANDEAKSVTFRVNLIATDKSKRLDFEYVVEGGGIQEFEMEIPSELRRPCDVLLSVQMTDEFDPTKDAWARWVDPAFKSRGMN